MTYKLSSRLCCKMLSIHAQAVLSACTGNSNKIGDKLQELFEIPIKNGRRTAEPGERHGKRKEMLGEREQKEEFLLLD